MALNISGRVMPSGRINAGFAGIVLPSGWVMEGGRMWALPNPAQSGTLAAANSYASTANIEGYTGWRVPTVAEIQAMRVEYTREYLYSIGWSNTLNNWHWTNTFYGGPNYYVWSLANTNGTPESFSFAPASGSYKWFFVRDV